MDSKIIVEKSKKQKQIDFLKELVEAPRDKAKNTLMKQTDRAIEAIVEFKADLVTNGINAHIFDFNYNDTTDIFKPLKEIIGYMDFIIETESNRIIDLSLSTTEDEINRMEAKDLQRKKEEADKEYNAKVKKIATEQGTIFFDY